MGSPQRSSYDDGTDVFSHTFSMEVDGIAHIWNVESLWVRAQDLIVERFSVDELLRECDSWVRSKDLRRADGTIHRVMAADLNYPVIISPEYFLMDGNHRLAKAVETGVRSVYGVRFPKLPEPDLIRVLEIP